MKSLDSNSLPEQFQNVTGFGNPVSCFPVKVRNRMGALVSGALLLAGGGAAFLWGTYYAYVRYLKFGPAIVRSSLLGPWVLAGFLFFLGLLAASSAISNWNKGAVVYKNGLAYCDRKEMHVWRWRDFHSLTAEVTRNFTSGIYTGTTHTYTLLRKNGEKLVVTDVLVDVEDLAGEIRQSIFPLLYESFNQAYNSGKTCVFGPVKISKLQGILLNKKQYPWDQVQEVVIQNGELSIKKVNGGWFSGARVPAAKIPNLEVMLSIIDQVVQVRSG